MKRYVIFIGYSIFTLFTTLYWFIIYFKSALSFEKILYLIPFLLIIGIGFYIGIKSWKSFKSGEPEEDELSKRIILKASSVSFYISYCLWIVLMYLYTYKIIEPDIMFLFIMGIFGMLLIFAISWLVISRIGIKNE